MKIQIRQGVFETNSSSVHSVAILTKQEFEEFDRGDRVIDPRNIYTTILKEDLKRASEVEWEERVKYITERWNNDPDFYGKRGGRPLEEFLRMEKRDFMYRYRTDYAENNAEVEIAMREIGDETVYAVSLFKEDY